MTGRSRKPLTVRDLKHELATVRKKADLDRPVALLVGKPGSCAIIAGTAVCVYDQTAPIEAFVISSGRIR